MITNQRAFLRVLGVTILAAIVAALVLMPYFASARATPNDLATLTNPNLMFQFENLAQRYPEPFKKYFGRPNSDGALAALRLGQAVFISEGCWQCHGPTADSRRSDHIPPPSIAPNLNKIGGRFSNDWHAVHLFNPQWTVANSPMPAYPWLFDGAPDRPNHRGLALITYLQWLGSWLESYPYYESYRTIEQLQEAAEEAGLGKVAN